MPSSIPVELFDLFFSYCGPAELSQLAKVDRFVHKIVTPLLYRTIRRLTVDQATECLTTLCFNAKLAHLVHSISIDWRKISLNSPISRRSSFRSMMKYGTLRAIAHRHVLLNRIALINAALQQMKNLTSFTFMVSANDKHDGNASRILAGCSKCFSLTNLTTSLLCDTAMMTFIRQQPQLASINLTYGCRMLLIGKYALTPSALPALKAFGWTEKVPADQVLHFIVGRPVERVNLVLAAEETVKLVDSLGTVRPQITSAFFKFRTDVGSLHIAYIARHLPNLRKLRLNLVTIPLEDIMNSFTHSFAFFPCLEVVIIVFKDYYGIDVQEFMTEYARKWFQKCPTLVHIDLPQCGKRLEKRKPLPVSIP